MHTLATLLEPGLEEPSCGADGILVGRRVANEAFLRALLRHADVARFLWFIGEEAQRTPLLGFIERLAHLDPQRIQVAHRLQLPDMLAAGEISVLHHESHWGWFFDLVALRDRFAPHHVPVTGQIHSLSYPRMLESYLRGHLNPPGAGDAVFCSSQSGLHALDESLKAVVDAANARGWPLEPMPFQRALVPLGIDCDELDASASAFPRTDMRGRLGISPEAVVVLGMGRFSEYDKMDLFPLLRALAALLEQHPHLDVQLILAGARQGTGTADMIKVWARALGVGERVHFVLDFPAQEKGAWLAAADIFVSPSDNVQETFGLSVIEAMAMGLPVIVSDFDGYRDTVPAHAGWRVQTQQEADLSLLALYGQLLFERPLHLLLGQGVSLSPRALLSALTEACVAPAERLARGVAARIHSRASYDWKHVVPRYEDTWRRLRMMPKAPVSQAPFGMDFGRIFAGHFAEHEGDDVPLAVIGDPQAIKAYVHPELRPLFQLDDVRYALAVVHTLSPTAAMLREHLRQQRFSHTLQGALSATMLVAWLLKQGHVERR